jgi:hypothetical protein
MQLDRYADFLRPFIWSLVFSLMRFRDGSDKGTTLNCVQISEKVLRRLWLISQAFGEECISRTRKVQTH